MIWRKDGEMQIMMVFHIAITRGERMGNVTKVCHFLQQPPAPAHVHDQTSHSLSIHLINIHLVYTKQIDCGLQIPVQMWMQLSG